ncbi:ImmA/IrrE family metallo-endopeptidase [Neobacillus sp. SM06]|uniref:ImmA/IrrE family metallo-endopeptidase n=1 Tax=Neobacillus sp. SM06 TaxID=3422492 RepID=UPI003D2AF9D7
MPKLTDKNIFEIKELVKEKRGQLNIGMGPIGENIFKIARQLNIKLVFLPIDNKDNPDDAFSALYLVSKETNRDISFIGLNTSQRQDRQIFSIAHELYHHWTGTTLSVCHLDDEKSELVELKANRFAAEFLLPYETLFYEIGLKNEGKNNLYNFSYAGLLRFIALLHCDYRLPFKAIVRRLHETKAINETQLELLNKENSRDPEGLYFKIGISQDENVFKKLNEPTFTSGVDGENIDLMINLLENGTVTLEELSEDLSLFDKNLGNFGLEEDVDQEDLDEINAFLKDFENEAE